MENIEFIPKKIHYCWIGKKEKPESVKLCIDSWRKFAPDYEIIEWNEDNFELENCNEYIKEALQMNKWAFVTDYMRLKILYNEGGIYLDTDVELLRSIDDLLGNNSFICLESLNTVCTAVIGSKRKQEWIKELIDMYDKRCFIKNNGNMDLTPNSKYIYQFLNNKYVIDNDKINSLSCNLTIYPSEYFSPKNYLTMKMNLTENTYAIHHYGGMWKSPITKLKDRFLAFITRIIGEENRIILVKLIKGE